MSILAKAMQQGSGHKHQMRRIWVLRMIYSSDLPPQDVMTLQKRVISADIKDLCGPKYLCTVGYKATMLSAYKFGAKV